MQKQNKYQKFFKKQILITGGMGFIGSSLAIKLAKIGAKVTILDAMIPGYGGNTFNIEPVKDMVVVNYSDIRDINSVNYLVRDKDYIFHLAGQVDHILSLSDPYPDIDINIKGTVVLMEACKHFNPTTQLVYIGTRGQYGRAVELPVKEDAPTHPIGIYEISRLSAEKIVKVYNDIHGIHSVMLRLTNIYGPRSQMIHSRYGVANWFIRQALDGETIKVFGDGRIKRDFLYIDDCVNAILMSAISESARGEIMNIGMDKPSDFITLAKEIIRIAKQGKWEYAPFTAERKAQEPGDFYSDITKIKTLVGWKPEISLNEGLEKTIDFYRTNKRRYW